MKSTPVATSAAEPSFTATLRESCNAMLGVSDTRRDIDETRGKNATIQRLITESCEQAAQALKSIARIIECDQAVLRLSSQAPVSSVPSLFPSRPTCSVCGSAEVIVGAAVRWNVKNQDWEVSNIFDNGHRCDDCQSHDIEFTWVEVSPGEAEHRGRA